MLARCLAALVVVVLVGCGGGPKPTRPTKQETDTRGSATRVPALERAWSVSAGKPFSRDLETTIPQAWTVGDLLVVPTARAIVGIDLAGGETRWKRPVGPVCSIAPKPNAQGVVAVLVGSGNGIGGGCRSIVTVDTATGERTQRISLRGLGGGEDGYGLGDLAIGESAVVASNTCDAAYSFSLRTGRRATSFPGAGRTEDGCVNGFASDGTTVVRADRDEAERFVGYDAATGRRRFEVPIAPVRRDTPPNVRINRVVASEPAIVDASVNGGRYLRLVDGRSQIPIGRESDDSYPPELTEVIGDLLVVQYGNADRLFVLERSTGRTVRSVYLEPEERALGVRAGQVLTLAPATTDVGAAEVASQVRSVDPASGEITVLGVVEGGSGFELATGIDPAFLAGDTLVVPSDGRLTGFRIPAEGRPVDDAAAFARFGDGDVPPVIADDLCTAVTPETKRALGFLEPRAPAPATCNWAVQSTSEALVFVDADAYAIAPAGGRTGPESARAAASGLIEPDTTNDLPAMRPLSGLGDEAWSRSARTESARVTDVVVRKDNVIIRVSARHDRRSPSVSAASTRKAVRSAAAEMLAELARRR